VEAIQVPFDRTTSHLLELDLNRRFRTLTGSTQYEVLNFGISNFGVRQYLLCWEEYASRFAPDLVFILVADFHMQRTVTREEESSFSP